MPFCVVLGVPAHAVGREAGEELLNQLSHGGCVDDYLQDQVQYHQHLTLQFSHTFVHTLFEVGAIYCSRILSRVVGC